MAEYEYSLDADVAAEAVYALYSDVSTWPSWDGGVEKVTVDGPFAAGTTGTFTPTGGDPLRFTIVSAEPGRGFVDEFPLPGAMLRGTHTLTPLAGGRTRITHRMQLEGPAAAELAPELMPGVTDDIPVTVASLARRAGAR
jgi:uncharacterized protein YndB with AHSA1/START domain